MTKKRFLFNAAAVSAVSVLLKCAGLFFRVYLSEAIGAEGMGLYQLIFSMYVFLISLSSSGLNLAVTKLVSEQSGKKNDGKKQYTVSCGCIYTFCTFAAIFIFVNIFADKICIFVLKDTRCAHCIKILLPSLLFIGFSSVFKGYFNAEGKAYHISLSQIAEDAVKIAAVVFVFSKYGIKNAEHACRIISAAITVSEICSCLFLYTMYKRNVKNIKPCKSSNLSKRLIATVFTIAAGGIATNFLHTAENILIPSGLSQYGKSAEKALSLYGMLRGMAMPVLLFPSSMINAASMLTVPEISRADTIGSTAKVRRTICLSLQTTLVLSFFVFGIFIAYSENIGLVLYKNITVGKIIKVFAPLLPFMYADSVVFSLLAGMDMQKTALAISISDSAARVALIYFLVPKIGFSGIVITMYISNIATPLLGGAALFKKTKITPRVANNVLLPLAAALCASFSARIIFKTQFAAGTLLYSAIYFFIIEFRHIARKKFFRKKFSKGRLFFNAQS